MNIEEEWSYIEDRFKILKLEGKGVYGQVVKAQCRTTEQIYAIKLLRSIDSDVQYAKKIYREISILKQISKIPNNIFTVKLKDVIVKDLPQEDIRQIKKNQSDC